MPQDLGMQEQQFIAKIEDDLLGVLWQVQRFAIYAVFGKLQRVVDALRQDDTKFSQLRTQHINGLRPLPHDQVTRAMDRQYRLLFGRLHFNKPHCGAGHRFANGRSINGV